MFGAATILLLGVSELPLIPVGVGTEWVYDLDVSGVKGSLSQTVVTSLKVHNGWEVAIRSRIVFGSDATSSVERWIVRSNFVGRVEGAWGVHVPALPLCILSGSMAWSGKVGDSTGSAMITAFDGGRIKTPVGEFETIASSVSLRAVLSGRYVSLPATYWLSRGVGFVRIEADLPGGSLMGVLRSWSRDNGASNRHEADI